MRTDPDTGTNDRHPRKKMMMEKRTSQSMTAGGAVGDSDVSGIRSTATTDCLPFTVVSFRGGEVTPCVHELYQARPSRVLRAQKIPKEGEHVFP